MSSPQVSASSKVAPDLRAGLNLPGGQVPPEKSPRIALVIVWSGPWKPWINLYIETCRHNPAVQFLFFTDQPAPAGRAPNVRFIPCARADFAQRIRGRLGFEPWLKRAYKLCDYKPFFGLLFAPELAGFTHWGYCDEDIFWGDLARFLPPELLAANDVVTSTRCCIAGQLTVFKNEAHANELVLRVAGWRDLLLTPHTTNLAETIINAQAVVEEAGGGLRVSRRQIQVHDEHDEEWGYWASELERAETGRELGILPYGAATWQNGQVRQSATGPEFAFFHFKVWKKIWNLGVLPPPPPGITGWTCTARGLAFHTAPGRRDARVIGFLLQHRVGAAAACLRRLAKNLRRQWQIKRADAARARERRALAVTT